MFQGRTFKEFAIWINVKYLIPYKTFYFNDVDAIKLGRIKCLKDEGMNFLSMFA